MSDDQPIQSEDEIIRDFLRPLTQGCAAALDLKDDAACLTPKPDMDLVITSDMLVAGVHFRPNDKPEAIGHKAFAVNVSDLVAKGATPDAFTLSLALPRGTTRGWARAFFSGAEDWVSGKLIGGDLVSTDGPLTISVTAIGTVPCGQMIARTTARPGDAVFVTGTLGESALGLRLLEDQALADVIGLTHKEAKFLERAYLYPDPPVALIEKIRTTASAGMDISDGLVRDAQRMCTGSGVGMEIDAATLPLSKPMQRAQERDPSLRALALTGGDDYQVLMSVPEEHAAQFADGKVDDVFVTHIGHVTNTRGELVVRDRGRATYGV